MVKSISAPFILTAIMQIISKDTGNLLLVAVLIVLAMLLAAFAGI